jgi:hypothetical protein
MAHEWRSLALLVGLCASAGGMTAAPQSVTHCHLLGPAKLPTASGGISSICAALNRSLTASGFNPRFTVAVRVLKGSLLNADITLVDGRVLPTLQMAQMDGPITKAVLERFGVAIADHVATNHVSGSAN